MLKNFFSVLILLNTLFLTVWLSPIDSWENGLKDTLYRKCWKSCLEEFNVSPSQKAVLAVINRQFTLEKHEIHCRAYNDAKKCAYSCLSSPYHEHYLRPFIRQNYLNDFICARHYNEFQRYLSCYQSHTSLEQYFIRCGYFAIESNEQLEATSETCAALRCVTKYIPGLIRQQCSSIKDYKTANEAGDLMERMVAAFLREKVRLNRMKRLCEESYF